MATNPTKDPMKYIMQQLKNAEIHLDAAIKRTKNAQEKQKIKKEQLGDKYKRPDIPDTNSEIENLKIKINNLRYCIECMEKVQQEAGVKSVEIANVTPVNQTIVCKNVSELKKALMNAGPNTSLGKAITVKYSDDNKICSIFINHDILPDATYGEVRLPKNIFKKKKAPTRKFKSNKNKK